jgi:hypothetical protein
VKCFKPIISHIFKEESNVGWVEESNPTLSINNFSYFTSVRSSCGLKGDRTEVKVKVYSHL